MVSSAVYRYFASRDELLTALIIDAYNALGAEPSRRTRGCACRPRGTVPGSGPAIRRWGLAHPYEYALIYGSPVPGYVAPDDTIAAASRTSLVLTGILADGHASALGAPGPSSPRRCAPTRAVGHPARRRRPAAAPRAGLTVWMGCSVRSASSSSAVAQRGGRKRCLFEFELDRWIGLLELR